MNKHRDAVLAKNDMLSKMQKDGVIPEDFLKVCVKYHSLEYIRHFEEIIYELIYRRLRHNNEKQVTAINASFELA